MIIEAILAIDDRINAATFKPGSRVFVQTGVYPDEWGIEYMDGYEAEVSKTDFLRGTATVQKPDGSQEVVPGHRITSHEIFVSRA